MIEHPLIKGQVKNGFRPIAVAVNGKVNHITV